MKILAVEFSSSQRSVAVLESAAPGKPGELGLNHGPDHPLVLGQAMEAGVPGAPALQLIAQALQAAKLERESLECLAIGLGPGSYTGIRSAIALAQGWQLAWGTKLVGLSSVEALAAQAHAHGWFGLVQMVIDAQRHEFYLAAYDIRVDGWTVVEPLRLASREEVAMKGQRGDRLAGPEVTRWFPAGSVLFPQAATLGQLAIKNPHFVRGDQLEPIYLRASQFVKAPPPRVIPE